MAKCSPINSGSRTRILKSKKVLPFSHQSHLKCEWSSKIAKNGQNWARQDIFGHKLWDLVQKRLDFRYGPLMAKCSPINSGSKTTSVKSKTVSSKHIHTYVNKKNGESKRKCSDWSLERRIDSVLDFLESSGSQEKTATNIPNLVFC